MLDVSLYIGCSVEIVEKYCGVGGVVEKVIVFYVEYIKGFVVVEFNV